jgi:hypothetical protein
MKMENTLEQNARRAKEACSFSDYKPGSATAEYNGYCAEAEEIANRAKARLAKTSAPAERAERVDYLLNLYKSKKLAWLNDLYANRARVPSILITGGSNFPVRAKEKQNAREDSLMKQNPDYILDEIRGIGQNAGTIYSDEGNAVERIKAKIAALEAAPPDRWGYNKTEIRRLKERLLQLAPDEMKAGKQITINGQPATFESIVNVFNSFKPQCSRYSPEENRFYLSIPFIISDGTRNYKCFVSCETNENGTEISTHGNADNGYKPIWKPLDDERKFNLMIWQMSGSGNKSVIYSILKDLAPAKEAKPEALETDGDTADTVTINGETAKIIRNKEEMRLQLVFDGKPAEKTREILKSNGFRWAPSQTAWQRLLNDNAEYALKRIAA